MAHAIGFDNEKQKPIICHHCGSCAKYCPHGCLTMLTVSD
jgi:NAD-dependent dihydropyrimidine dehydrogenase PreA subunit